MRTLENIIACIIKKKNFSFDSLGIVLTRGYGQYIFIGNVSVEEGESFFLNYYE